MVWALRFVEMRGRSIFDLQNYTCTHAHLLSALKARGVRLSGEAFISRETFFHKIVSRFARGLSLLRRHAEILASRQEGCCPCAGVLERRETHTPGESMVAGGDA